MKKIILYILFFIRFFLSCENTQKYESNFSHITINIPEKEIQLNASDLMSEMKLIKLEQTNESVVDEIVKIEFYNDNIFIQDKSFQGLFVFDGEGHFQRLFNQQGNGPGEYKTLDDFLIDPQNKTLEILDKPNNKINVYDLLEFNFIESYNLPVQVVFKFNKQKDNYFFQTNGSKNKIDNDVTYSDIIMFNKKTSKIFPLFERETPTSNMHFEFSNVFYTNDDNELFVSLAWDESIYKARDKRIDLLMLINSGSRGIPQSVLKGSSKEKIAFISSESGKDKIGGFRLLHYERGTYIIAYGTGVSNKQHLYFSFHDDATTFAASRIVNDMASYQLPDINIFRVTNNEIISVIYPVDINHDNLQALNITENDNPLLGVFKLKPGYGLQTSQIIGK
jgi:hypothetical protein